MPLVLAGGAGRRLWPLSRAGRPKQFLPLFGGLSTYQTTLRRVSGASLFAPPLVMTSAAAADLAHAQARELGIEAMVVVEPVRRDSCAAVAAGALVAAGNDPRALVLALAADQLIDGEAAFVEGVRRAAPVAAAGRIVAFGITPSRVDTAMGYVLPGAPLGEDVFAIDRFVEKPDARRAADCIGEGMLWNGGNFLFRADTLVEEVARCAPAIHAAVVSAVRAAGRSGERLTLDRAAFGTATALSLDRAVMEKTGRAAVARCGYAFTDMGAWPAVVGAARRDTEGNAVSGSVLAVATHNAFLCADGLRAVVAGLDGVVVVATPEGVLVAAEAALPGLGQIVAPAGPDASTHDWGSREELVTDGPARVGRLTVEPGCRIDLAAGHGPGGHWIVTRGEASVVLPDRSERVAAGGSIRFPPNGPASLANAGSEPLELIEVRMDAGGA